MATLLLLFCALALAQVPDEPIITAAPEPTEVVLFPNDLSATGEPCKQVICYDYINTCSIRYGGCYQACAGNARPTYSGALCEGGIFTSSFSKPPAATQPDPCGYKCEYSTDTCGNTFGPGCYTSCPGIEPPSYTVPSCDALATPAQTIYVTPVPAANTVELTVPLEVLEKRQEDTAESATVSLDDTSEVATTSEGPVEFTLAPIPEGSATIGADLSTIEPQSTESSASNEAAATSSDLEAPTSSTEAESEPTPTDAALPSSPETASSIEASGSGVPAATQSESLEEAPATTAQSSDAGVPSPTVTDSSGGDDGVTVSPVAPVTLWTPEPIPAGGATIGANLATIRPTVYGYLPVADIMDSPEQIAANQAANQAAIEAANQAAVEAADQAISQATPDAASVTAEEAPAAVPTGDLTISAQDAPAAATTQDGTASTEEETPTPSIDGDQLNSAIFAVNFVSSTEIASEATATETATTAIPTGIIASEQPPPADDGEPSK